LRASRFHAVQACPTASAIGQDGNSLCAVISSIDGKYGLTVRDARGALDKVTLHQGTIINPTGLQLTPGTPVYIVGRVDGGSFDADRIDAPFEATRVPARDTAVSVRSGFRSGFLPGRSRPRAERPGRRLTFERRRDQVARMFFKMAGYTIVFRNGSMRAI